MLGGPILGIDLGGTKSLAIVALTDGTILSSSYKETPSSKGREAVADVLAECAVEAASLAGIPLSKMGAAGFAVAGLVDRRNGIILASPNLQGWNDVPLASMMQKRLSLRCVIANDANAAAIGELLFGAGQGVKDQIFITISTGIGAGIIAGGRLYIGASGTAGEIGHMTIVPNGPKCGCGRYGCWEALASGTAIARSAAEGISAGRQSIIPSLIQQNPVQLSAREVFEAARQGDSFAREIVSQASNYLGIGLANLINIFNPELFVIGGGISKEWDSIMPQSWALAQERAFSLPAQKARMEKAALNDFAGAMGAVALVSDEYVWT